MVSLMSVEDHLIIGKLCNLNVGGLCQSYLSSPNGYRPVVHVNLTLHCVSLYHLGPIFPQQINLPLI